MGVQRDFWVKNGVLGEMGIQKDFWVKNRVLLERPTHQAETTHHAETDY